MKKNSKFLLNLLIIVGSASAMKQQKLNDFEEVKTEFDSSINDSIDTAALISEIKNVIYNVFFYEMAILSIGDYKVAQGNADLEKDLKDLYMSFNVGTEKAQAKIDAFCKKWKLGRIKIEDCYN